MTELPKLMTTTLEPEALERGRDMVDQLEQKRLIRMKEPPD